LIGPGGCESRTIVAPLIGAGRVTARAWFKSDLDTQPERNFGMTEYGITRVPVDFWQYKQFRYTNLDDAIAQARRDRPTGGSYYSAGDELHEYGISRMSVDYYHYKEFRYTNLDDAIAQARHQNAIAGA
jgi:hypothetical protein